MRMPAHKITPCLWSDTQAEEALAGGPLTSRCPLISRCAGRRTPQSRSARFAGSIHFSTGTVAPAT